MYNTLYTKYQNTSHRVFKISSNTEKQKVKDISINRVTIKYLFTINNM